MNARGTSGPTYLPRIHIYRDHISLLPVVTPDTAPPPRRGVFCWEGSSAATTLSAGRAGGSGWCGRFVLRAHGRRRKVGRSDRLAPRAAPEPPRPRPPRRGTAAIRKARPDPPRSGA